MVHVEVVAMEVGGKGQVVRAPLWAEWRRPVAVIPSYTEAVELLAEIQQSTTERRQSFSLLVYRNSIRMSVVVVKNASKCHQASSAPSTLLHDPPCLQTSMSLHAHRYL